MQIFIHNTNTFNLNNSHIDTVDTLILSTQNIRYKNVFNARVFQVRSDDIFTNAIEEFHAARIVLDLFDTLASNFPQAVGTFLDDFEAGVYQSTQLDIVINDKSLIEYWELDGAPIL